ncbi:MAG: GNAT family N-acetyltransferase [Chloroflexi bacterium]|nr:GNAT family N-acetyltransferase [Chloroflexota bacterium]
MTPPVIDLPDRLETQRLLLRPYTPADAPAYLEMCLRNKSHLLPYEQGNPALDVATPEQAEELMGLFADLWAARKAFFLGAWEKADGTFAAQMYIGVVKWELPEFEVGYFVDQAKEGRGFVSESVQAALALCFDRMGAHRLTLRCNETNMRSRRVAERAGFVLEGLKRETHRDILRPDGRFSGDYLYGLLASEYYTQGNSPATPVEST